MLKLLSKYKIYIVLSALLVLGLIAFVLAVVYNSYRISKTGTIEVRAYNACYKIKSTDGKDYFLPLKTQGEWDAFVSNRPASLQVTACPVSLGCKLKYRIKTSTDESEWVETDWGTANGGDWVYGPAAFVTGNPASIAVEVAVMCDEGSSLKLGYRFRGNRGPYWNTTIGSHYADRIVDSGTNTWQSAGYTDPFPKSCNIKGGDGGCGIMIYELDESGPVQCDTQVRYNGFVAYKPGGWGPGYAATYGMSASANTNCNGSGCSIEMAIKCSAQPVYLFNNTHTTDDCQAAGGTPVNVGTDSNPEIVCQFVRQPNCPAGWTKYQNWSHTISRTCSDTQCNSSCTTGEHAWANIATESCTYTTYQVGWKTAGCTGTGTCYADEILTACY